MLTRLIHRKLISHGARTIPIYPPHKTSILRSNGFFSVQSNKGSTTHEHDVLERHTKLNSLTTFKTKVDKTTNNS